MTKLTIALTTLLLVANVSVMFAIHQARADHEAQCRQTCTWTEEEYIGANDYGCFCMGTFAGFPSARRYFTSEESCHP